jgi:hypothetical protein
MFLIFNFKAKMKLIQILKNYFHIICLSEFLIQIFPYFKPNSGGNSVRSPVLNVIKFEKGLNHLDLV